MVTDAQRHKLNLNPITDAHLVLLEFQEDGSSLVHRACINNEAIVSNGNTYEPTNIELSLPSASSNDVFVSMTISNIDRLVGRKLSLAKRPVGVRIMLIDSSVPDTLLLDTANLIVILSASGDSESITAELGPRAPLTEPWPPQRTRKQFFPGLWFNS